MRVDDVAGPQYLAGPRGRQRWRRCRRVRPPRPTGMPRRPTAPSPPPRRAPSRACTPTSPACRTRYKAAPARCCSPRHRMPFSSKDEGSNALDDLASNACQALRDDNAAMKGRLDYERECFFNVNGDLQIGPARCCPPRHQHVFEPPCLEVIAILSRGEHYLPGSFIATSSARIAHAS